MNVTRIGQNYASVKSFGNVELQQKGWLEGAEAKKSAQALLIKREKDVASLKTQLTTTTDLTRKAELKKELSVAKASYTRAKNFYNEKGIFGSENPRVEAVIAEKNLKAAIEKTQGQKDAAMSIYQKAVRHNNHMAARRQLPVINQKRIVLSILKGENDGTKIITEMRHKAKSIMPEAELKVLKARIREISKARTLKNKELAAKKLLEHYDPGYKRVEVQRGSKAIAIKEAPVEIKSPLVKLATRIKQFIIRLKK